MSNINNTMQTQTSNALYNAIMEGGGIDNDIYFTVDACPNACKMWKAIERLKQGESINVQDLETNLYWEFGKYTSRDDDEISKDKKIDKLMALISLSFKKIYKPTNNNLRTSSTTSRANQDNSLRINKGTGEQGDTNITIGSLNMSTNGETVDQDDSDLANERDLLASLIEKQKYEIDDSKNLNKFLETSNKALVDKLKDLGEVLWGSKKVTCFFLGNRVGCTQSALFYGRMYFELLVYIPEASTLDFVGVHVGPLFVLPTASAFSVAISAFCVAIFSRDVVHKWVSALDSS
uniref:Uncharacterized protein n=1 Tax=Tanacetum cinerariifolium TaxID=118510 RepID=A0A6L2JEN4_TANCI|nr:hypothetical protein [Tanacetum cinerariifolium]